MTMQRDDSGLSEQPETKKVGNSDTDDNNGRIFGSEMEGGRKHEAPEGKEDDALRPLVDDFDEFLPWACNQLQVQVTVNVVRIVQNEYISAVHSVRSKIKSKSRARFTLSKADVVSENDDKSVRVLQGWSVAENFVRILTIYDSSENLIHIKFDNNIQVPQIILKIIGMIAQFQIYLTALTINRGLSASALYELCKFLPNSNLTDICLDNTFIPEANYHILLENQNFLRNLSLARCKIDDGVVEKIAAMLVYPLPASRTLSLLNLSTNMITDVGAKHLGNALRSNRQVCYLNVSSNMISDEGAESILGSLMEFPMTYEEIINSRTRHVSYLKDKNNIIAKIVKDLRAGDVDRKFKKKPMRPTTVGANKKGKLEREGSPRSLPDAKSLPNFESMIYDKAEALADATIGEFTDPFGTTETISKDGILYCIGNNTLSYLNLAYNNVSYFTVKRLLSVILYQKCLNRKPRGLINVCIEGNCLPTSCRELSQLDQMLEMGMLVNRRLSGVVRRKPQSRK